MVVITCVMDNELFLQSVGKMRGLRRGCVSIRICY